MNDSTATSNELRPDGILELGYSFLAAKTLMSAVELNVFTELAHGPAELTALASRLDLHPRSARDFLDALVALKLLEREGSVYRNAPQADLFLDAHKPSYVGGIIEMANRRSYGIWGSLTDALRTGQPQNEAASATDTFDELYSDPDRLRNFLRAMTGLSIGAAQAIAKKFPWNDYTSFADIGCAQGAAAVQIALAHPHLKASGYDLPIVRPIFEDYVKDFELNHRLGFLAGDFFKEPLPRAQVLIMGHILHDWNLAKKRILIGKAYEALPAGGALIVYESLIDDDRRQNAFGLLMSLNMLLETPGGFDFTGADCRQWLAEAGFRESWVEHLTGPTSMVVGFK